MSWLSATAGLETARQMAAIAHQLVQQRQAQGVALVGRGLEGLSLAASRGYVRAKLGGLLREEIARTPVPAGVDPLPFHTGILDRAVESLTQLILGETLIHSRNMRRAA